VCGFPFLVEQETSCFAQQTVLAVRAIQRLSTTLHSGICNKQAALGTYFASYSIIFSRAAAKFWRQQRELFPNYRSIDRILRGYLIILSGKTNFPPYFTGNWSFQLSLWSCYQSTKKFDYPLCEYSQYSTYDYVPAFLVPNTNSKLVIHIREAPSSNPKTSNLITL
jgi:hypothetical protein